MGNDKLKTVQTPSLDHSHDRLAPGLKDDGSHTKPDELSKLAPPLFGSATLDTPGVTGQSAFKRRPGVTGNNDDGGDGVLGQSAKGVGVHGTGEVLAGLFE